MSRGAEHSSFKLPRLYPILDIATLQRRNLELKIAARSLRAAGVGVVQLRDKASAPQQVLANAAIIKAEFSGSDATLIMNDRVDLALLAGWQAVHLGHKDLPPGAAREIFGDLPLTVGVSTHNEDQVRAADMGAADYIAIGPVFGTTSKTDTEPVVGLEGVRLARQLTRKPLVAIGGITAANAAAVIDAGADSVAIIGALLGAGNDLEAAARDFLRQLR